MKERFETQMDNTVKIITALVHLLVFAMLITGILIDGFSTDRVLVLLFLVLAFGLAYVLRPFEYWVDEEYITIHKNVLPKKIAITDVASIESIAFADLKIRLRLFGSGGLWGWYGIFWSAKYKKISLFCTEKKNTVLICTKDNKYYVLSPKESIAFGHKIQLIKTSNQEC
jgi:hypothetical protein